MIKTFDLPIFGLLLIIRQVIEIEIKEFDKASLFLHIPWEQFRCLLEYLTVCHLVQSASLGGEHR